MNRRKRRLWSQLIFGLVCLVPVAVCAEGSPEAVVSQMFADMKSAGNPSPIVKYVKWDRAYSDLPAGQREQMGVASPDQLKALMNQVLSDPAAVLRDRMAKELAGKSPEEKEMMNRMLAGMEAQVTQMKQKMSEEMKRTTMKVVSSDVNGNEAKVNVLVSKEGEGDKNHTIDMIKDGDRWYLPSIDFAKDQQAAGKPGGQIGG